MKFSDLRSLRFINFFKWHGGLPVILPFVGYILFGLGNIVMFSQAIKHLPTATAFAVWTAATLVFIKIAELLFFKQSISSIEVFFMLLIMGGIMGLRIYSVPAK